MGGSGNDDQKDVSHGIKENGVHGDDEEYVCGDCTDDEEKKESNEWQTVVLMMVMMTSQAAATGTGQAGSGGEPNTVGTAGRPAEQNQGAVFISHARR